MTDERHNDSPCDHFVTSHHVILGQLGRLSRGLLCFLGVQGEENQGGRNLYFIDVNYKNPPSTRL